MNITYVFAIITCLGFLVYVYATMMHSRMASRPCGGTIPNKPIQCVYSQLSQTLKCFIFNIEGVHILQILGKKKNTNKYGLLKS